MSILYTPGTGGQIKSTTDGADEVPHHFAQQSGAWTITLLAGTAGIGKLTANSGVDIGDVDVTSVIAGTGATNLGKAIDSAAGATDTGVAILAVRDDSLSTLTPAEGDYVTLRVDSTGALYVTGGGGGTQYAVDAALGSTPTGTLSLAIRDDALSSLSPAEGDAIGLRVDANGALWVAVSGSLTANAGTNLNTSALALESGGNLAAATTALQIIDDWDNAASDGASVSGDVAHDAADAGEPVKIGAKASTSLSGITLVADADRTNLFAGVDGVQIVRAHCNLEDIVTGNASNTDGSSTECIAAGAAGIKHYLTRVTLTNTSSSNIYVEIKDGSTVKHTVPVPANGGATIGFDPPLPGTAATAWNFDPSAAATTIICSMVGFKSKV